MVKPSKKLGDEGVNRKCVKMAGCVRGVAKAHMAMEKLRELRCYIILLIKLDISFKRCCIRQRLPRLKMKVHGPPYRNLVVKGPMCTASWVETCLCLSCRKEAEKIDGVNGDHCLNKNDEFSAGALCPMFEWNN